MQSFELYKEATSVNSVFVKDIASTIIEDVSSRQDWIYNMSFSGGVATLIDSSLVTFYDTTYTKTYDTTISNVSDTSIDKHSAKYVVNSIELPIYLHYSRALGRFEIFGGFGAHLNYATSVESSLVNAEHITLEKNLVRNFGLDASFKIGLSYIISPEIKLNVAPIYRMNTLQRFNFSNSRSSYTGITFSLLYRIK